MLIWKVPPVPVKADRGHGTQRPYWKAWYERNKLALAVARAERYREDPVYRAKCLARSRASRRRS